MCLRVESSVRRGVVSCASSHAMTRPVVALFGAALLASVAAAAQTRSTPASPTSTLARANPSGVAMGHYHFVVQDVAANARFWTALGGVVSKAGTTTIVKIT